MDGGSNPVEIPDDPRPTVERDLKKPRSKARKRALAVSQFRKIASQCGVCIPSLVLKCDTFVVAIAGVGVVHQFQTKAYSAIQVCEKNT